MAQTFETGRQVGGIGGGEPKVGHGGMPAVDALPKDIGEVADGEVVGETAEGRRLAHRAGLRRADRVAAPAMRPGER